MLNAIVLQPVCFPHPIRLLPEDRILDRLPDKVSPFPLGRGSDSVNCFQRCFIEVDEDLRHMDNLCLCSIYSIVCEDEALQRGTTRGRSPKRRRSGPSDAITVVTVRRSTCKLLMRLRWRRGGIRTPGRVFDPTTV